LLQSAVEGFGPSYARPRALYLPGLAGAHALVGNIDTAVTMGHQAIDAVTAVYSPRAYDRLHVLHTVLGPLHTSPGVAELRERLTATTF
jgi:N-acyl-L-homoserine lactone synthetase